MSNCIWTYLVPGERSDSNIAYNIGIQSMIEYSVKTKSDFFIHTKPMFPDLPCFYERFAVAKQVSHYKRVLVLGADVVIKNNAPNIFDEFTKGAWSLDENKAHPSTPHAYNFLQNVFSVYEINKKIDKTTPMWNGCVTLCDGKDLKTIFNCKHDNRDLWHDLSPYNANIHGSKIKVRDFGQKYNCFVSRTEGILNIKNCHFIHFDSNTKESLIKYENYDCAIKKHPYLI